jgi:protein-L-isoaspartate(D-aspartate) O-methyltransferase
MDEDVFKQNPGRSRRLTTKKRDLNLSRQYYAEELRAVADLQSESLVRAFAKVPREHFLGAGPWRVFSPGSETDWSTRDGDPRHLYHNLLVVIDAQRHLNNGYPSFLAFLIDKLRLQLGEHVVHIGCGTGYYTAIMADVVGFQGHVTAMEIDPGLAARAHSNLSCLPHVEVFGG